MMIKRLSIVFLVLAVLSLLFFLEYTVVYLKHPFIPPLANSLILEEQDPVLVDDITKEDIPEVEIKKIVKKPKTTKAPEDNHLEFVCPKSEPSEISLELVSFPQPRPLGSYIPNTLVAIPKKYSNNRNICVTASALEAFIVMHSDMEKQGLVLGVHYGFRDNDSQELLISNFSKNGKGSFVAPVGQSEHILGTAFDFISGTSSGFFASSREYRYLIKNAYKYGFVQSFQGKIEDETKTPNEPWHWRYVGVDVATAIKELGLPVNLFLKSR